MKSPEPSLTLIDRVVSLAAEWARANDRSESRLATIVANDGKLIDRLRHGAGATAATIERFFTFFRDPANWPDRALPAVVAATLDRVDLGTVAVHVDIDTPRSQGPSAGNEDANSRSVEAEQGAAHG